jgi:hypothetical protein
MGYGYLRRGDYENAYGAYDAAAEEYPPNSRAETRCKDNMAKIKRKQENPDAEVGFQRHGMDPESESLFYPLFKHLRATTFPFQTLSFISFIDLGSATSELYGILGPVAS